MKKINMKSSAIMALIAFILFNIMFINEDQSWKIVSAIFALIVFVLSLISTRLAIKIIEIGNSIKNTIFRIAYYMFLPFLLLILCIAAFIGTSNLSDYIISSNNLSVDFGEALYFLFFQVCMVIMIMVPYIQAVIINIIKKITK